MLRAIQRIVGANTIYEEVIDITDGAGNLIDPRAIRALTSSDIVSAIKSGTWNIDNLLNPHPVSLASIPNPSNLDVALSTRLKPADTLAAVTTLGNLLNPHPTLIQYPSGTTIDPRAIRALTSSDIVSAIKSGTWNIDNLLNPHPVSKSGTWNIDNLLNPHPIKIRDDLTNSGVSLSVTTGGTPVIVLAPASGCKLKIYDFSITHTIANSLVYFYFGTSTTPTGNIFGSAWSPNITGAVLVFAKTFVAPRCGAVNDSLYLYASVAGTYNVDFGYVSE